MSREVTFNRDGTATVHDPPGNDFYEARYRVIVDDKGVLHLEGYPDNPVYPSKDVK